MFSLLPIPLLHVGGPEPGGPLYTHWFLDPKIAASALVILGLYFAWMGPLNRRRPGFEERPVTQAQIRWFVFGTLIYIVALGPPVDDWSHFFFASVHMAQHLLLMFAVVPCWLKGIPAWVYQPIVKHPRLAWLMTWVPRAVPSFLIVTVIMGLWHMPLLYNATLENELVHTLQHTFFLLAGFLFFWPLMSPVPESPQLPPPMKCFYLFAQTIPSGIIGAMITYAGPGLYPHYAEASVRPFGIDLKTDQEIAGLMMWVGMNTIFLVMITVIFMTWANGEQRKDREALAAENRRRRQARLAVPADPPPTPAVTKP